MSPKQEQALDVIAQVAQKERATLKPEMELTADLGIDSPKGLQLLMELEDRLGLEISEDEAARITTVGDMLTFVGSR